MDIRMIREFEKGLKVRSLRPFLKTITVQVKLENSIIVRDPFVGQTF